MGWVWRSPESGRALGWVVKGVTHDGVLLLVQRSRCPLEEALARPSHVRSLGSSHAGYLPYFRYTSGDFVFPDNARPPCVKSKQNGCCFESADLRFVSRSDRQAFFQAIRGSFYSSRRVETSGIARQGSTSE